MKFDYLKLHMRQDGTEICTAYSQFTLDNREIWKGFSYTLTNNYIKNNWEIIKASNDMKSYKVVASGKDETLSLIEFKKWLEENHISDAYTKFLKNNEWYCKKYPNAMGVKEMGAGI